MSLLYPLDFVLFFFFNCFLIFGIFFLPVFLFLFLISLDPDKKSFSPAPFSAFISCLLIECFTGLSPLIASLTTEETKVYADGLAALKK